MAYSKDIGWRVVWKRIGLEMKFKDISKELNIAASTAHKIYHRFEQTGSVSATPPGSRPDCRKLDELHELFVIALVAENPCISLQEMCNKIEEATGLLIAGSTVCRVLKRNGYTRKQIQTVARQRSVDYRAYFRATVANFTSNQLVWLDETGSDARNHIRRYGYSLRGITPVYHRMLIRGRRVSAITAISNDGLVGVELTHGSVNGDIFADFVRGTLIPEMQSFDGSTEKKSVVIMDNCSIHHVRVVKDLLDSAGIITLYLPPYSPDYNPIELAFSSVKYYLKQHDELLQISSDPLSIIESAFTDNITEIKCKKWINNCGY